MLAPWKENYDQPEVNWSEVSQSCPTLCDSVDCGPPGSSVHGILQGRILEWVTISFSRGSSRPRDWTCIGGRRFNLWLKSREVTGPYSQSCDFSSTHVWIWELDHKEGWAPKNWCFRTVGLEKTLENPLDSKEIKPVNPKGNQSWILTGRTDAEAPILRPPYVKNQLIGKDPDAGEDWRLKDKRVAEDEMVR